MTKHPLTDQIIEKIAEDVFYYDHSIPIFKCDMRAAADWQLSQCLNYIRLTYGDEGMVPFMEAMRPTQENN